MFLPELGADEPIIIIGNSKMNPKMNVNARMNEMNSETERNGLAFIE